MASIPVNTEKKTIEVELLMSQLNLSRASIYKALNSGEIPAVRIGKRFLIPVDAADRILNKAG